MKLKFNVSKAKGARSGAFNEFDGEVREYDEVTGAYLLKAVHGYELVEEKKAVEERSVKPMKKMDKK